jgi:protein disulfide-isomerase
MGAANLARVTILAAVSAVLTLSPAAIAQRFSAPETAPATPPAGEPAKQEDADVQRVGGGMQGFKLPLSLYDEKADGAKQITQARERAKKDNRRVLVMWGENRCEFCAYLNQLLTTDPQIRQLIETEYEWVKIDIGKFDKHIDLAKSFSTPIDQQGFGAPALTVIEPNSGMAIGTQGGNSMVAKPMMPPNRVFDQAFVFNFLDSNKPQPKVATMLMLEAQQKAKRDGKRVLVYFNIYGSDACRIFDKAVNTAEASAALEKAYVIRKIDVERNIAGYDVLRRLKGSPTATPPWMTVLGDDGKPVAEAGAGVEFDPEQAENAVKWLVVAAGGKLATDDAAAVSKALADAAAPPPPPAAEPANAEAADSKK